MIFFSFALIAPLIVCLISFVNNIGYLMSVDSYLNLQLGSTEEWVDGAFAGNLGEVLIRCNNVLYIKEVNEPKDD